MLRVRHAALGASDAPDGYLLGEEQPATGVKEELEPVPDEAAAEPSAGTKRSLDDTGTGSSGIGKRQRDGIIDLDSD